MSYKTDWRKTPLRSMQHLQSEIDWRDDKIHRILSENESLHEHIDDAKKVLRDRYEFIKRKDRIIAMLSFALAIAVLVIIAALVIGGMNPDIGFFWLDR